MVNPRRARKLGWIGASKRPGEAQERTEGQDTAEHGGGDEQVVVPSLKFHKFSWRAELQLNSGKPSVSNPLDTKKPSKQGINGRSMGEDPRNKQHYSILSPTTRTSMSTSIRIPPYG